MMVEKNILEAIDACRPGSDDLHQPELAEVAAQVATDDSAAAAYRRVQSLDGKISQAMGEVAVPEGLEERLLGRLADQEAVADRSEEPAAVALEKRISRRVWFSGGFALAVAASLVVAVSLALRWRAPASLTRENIEQLVADWDQGIASDGWQSLDSAPENHPDSGRVVPRARSWQPLACAYDRRAVVYDHSRPGDRHQVRLMVIRAPVADVGSVPPPRAFFTQGRSIAAWHEGGLLYVLVITGPAVPDRVYREFVDTKPGPLA